MTVLAELGKNFSCQTSSYSLRADTAVPRLAMRYCSSSNSVLVISTERPFLHTVPLSRLISSASMTVGASPLPW